MRQFVVCTSLSSPQCPILVPLPSLLSLRTFVAGLRYSSVAPVIYSMDRGEGGGSKHSIVWSNTWIKRRLNLTLHTVVFL